MRKGCLSSDVERTGVSGMCCFSWAVACQVGPRFHHLLGGNPISTKLLCIFYSSGQNGLDSEMKTSHANSPEGVVLQIQQLCHHACQPSYCSHAPFSHGSCCVNCTSWFCVS